MNGKNIKRLIAKDFDAFAAENGYLNKRHGFNYCCENGIMKAVGFEYKSSSASARYFVFPLYIGKYDYLILEYGDTLERKGGADYILYYDSEDGEILHSYGKIKEKFRKCVFPKMDRISAAEDVVRECGKGKLLFPQPINLLKLKAYSAAYDGRYDTAAGLFEKYVDEKKKLTPDSELMELEYIAMLRNTPERFKEILRENREYTLAANDLKCGNGTRSEDGKRRWTAFWKSL